MDANHQPLLAVTGCSQMEIALRTIAGLHRRGFDFSAGAAPLRVSRVRLFVPLNQFSQRIDSSHARDRVWCATVSGCSREENPHPSQKS
jgi:hypothetical protein